MLLCSFGSRLFHRARVVSMLEDSLSLSLSRSRNTYCLKDTAAALSAAATNTGTTSSPQVCAFTLHSMALRPGGAPWTYSRGCKPFSIKYQNCTYSECCDVLSASYRNFSEIFAVAWMRNVFQFLVCGWSLWGTCMTHCVHLWCCCFFYYWMFLFLLKVLWMQLYRAYNI